MSSLIGIKVPPTSISTFVFREYTTTFFLCDGVLTSAEGILLLSETTLVLSEGEGADCTFEKEEFSVQPFVFPAEDDCFLSVTITGSEDQMSA